MASNVYPISTGGGASAGGGIRVQLKQIHDAERSRLLRFLTSRLGSPSEAEDVLQLAFTRLWQNADRLRAEDLTALFYVTARNIATNELRVRSRRGRTFIAAADCSAQVEVANDPAPLPDRAMEAQQQVRAVLTIIEELPLKCRTAFIRYKLEGQGYPDIAASMGITESMVRKYVLRAVAHCAARLDQIEGWD